MPAAAIAMLPAAGRHGSIKSGPEVLAPRMARLRSIVSHSRRHGLWIAAWSLVGWVGTALTPALLDRPLLLMMLSPRAVFVALASESVSLVPFVLLGTARLGITDASYFIIGKRFGCTVRPPPTRPASAWRQLMRRGDLLCRWLCSRPRMAGAFLFFRPNGKYLALAGAYRVPAWAAGLSSAAGTACFLAAVHIGIGSLL